MTYIICQVLLCVLHDNSGLQQSYGVGTMTLPILQKRGLRQKEVKYSGIVIQLTRGRSEIQI